MRFAIKNFFLRLFKPAPESFWVEDTCHHDSEYSPTLIEEALRAVEEQLAHEDHIKYLLSDEYADFNQIQAEKAVESSYCGDIYKCLKR